MNEQNLKDITLKLSNEIKSNQQLSEQIDLVMNSFFINISFLDNIVSSYDANKPNRGEKVNGFNLRVKNITIQEIYKVNPIEAIYIFNNLSNEDKKIFDNLIINKLDSMMGKI